MLVTVILSCFLWDILGSDLLLERPLLCNKFSNPCKQKKPKHFAASVNGIYQVNKRDKQKGPVSASAIRTPSSLSKCMHFRLRFQINVQCDSNGIWQGYLMVARQVYYYLQNI